MGKKRQNRRNGRARAAMNTELAEALSGVSSRPNNAIFFEDRKVGEGESRRTTARRLRYAEEQRLAEEAANRDKLASKHELKKVEQLAERLEKSDARDGAVEGKKRAASHFFDLWGGEGKGSDSDSDRVAAEVAKPPCTKRARIVREHVSTHHKVVAVKVSNPGTSYNPEATAYKEALKETVTAHVEYEEKKRTMKVIRAKEEADALPVPKLEDDESSDEEEEEVEEEQKEGEEGTTPKRRKKDLLPGERITRAQRNKEKRKRITSAHLSERQKEKARLAEIEQAQELAKELEERAKQTEERAKRRKEKRAQELNEEPEPRFSSGHRAAFVPGVEVVLPSDLSGVMRNLKPHGNLALERFQSLHTRNMAEVRNPQRRTKRTHKPWVKDVAVGSKFIEEEHDKSTGKKKKQRRMMPGGRIDISA